MKTTQSELNPLFFNEKNNLQFVTSVDIIAIKVGHTCKMGENIKIVIY